MGYTIATILEYLMAFCVITLSAIMINLGIGLFFLGLSTTKDLENNLHLLIESKIFTKGNQLQALQQLAHFCRFHSISKKLDMLKYCNVYKLKVFFFCRIVNGFSILFQPVLMVLFLWCNLSISGIMLMIQIQIVKCNDLLIGIMMNS